MCNNTKHLLESENFSRYSSCYSDVYKIGVFNTNIESLCCTLLTDKNIEVPKTYNDKFLTWFNNNQNFFVVESSLKDVFKENIIDNVKLINKFRNRYDDESHGRDVDHPKIDEIIQKYLGIVSDAVCWFMLNINSKDYDHIGERKLKYDDLEIFNIQFDDLNEDSTGYGLSMSKCLFEHDYIAYKESYLNWYDEHSVEDENMLSVAY